MEFALILPFFVVTVFLVFVFLEIAFRAVCVSYAGFCASRRSGVSSFGGVSATEYVRRGYAACGMRGYPVVDAKWTEGMHPRLRSVGVVDTYTVLWPTGQGTPVFPELREKRLEVAIAPVVTAGTSFRSLRSDNEL